MTARQLMRLYPRGWRARYGEEFVEVIGEKTLSVQQAIDIVAGAVDAWVSPAVRASVRGPATSGSGGATMIQELKMKCVTTTPRYTTKDGLIGAAVMIGSTVALLAIGIAARRLGYTVAGEALKGLAFPASLLLSMPFYATKGQSWRAQFVLLGIPMLILVVISYLSTQI